MPQLRAERQLAAIEAAVVSAALQLKPDAAKRVIARHRNAAKPPAERTPASMQLLDGFREAGFKVVRE